MDSTKQNIIDFICKFKKKGGKGTENVFKNGYCLYFAKMLEYAFPGGRVVWCAPYDHVAYEYDGIVYDINGVYKEKVEKFIDINDIGDMIVGFKHIPGEYSYVTDKEIFEMIERSA